jgi:prevent-host-death family protein
MILNLSEAKANLSKLVDRAFQGEEIVIAKNNLPLVDLVPHKPKGQRKLGGLKGKIKFDADLLMAEDKEIEEMFYGSSK